MAADLKSPLPKFTKQMRASMAVPTIETNNFAFEVNAEFRIESTFTACLAGDLKVDRDKARNKASTVSLKLQLG